MLEDARAAKASELHQVQATWQYTARLTRLQIHNNVDARVATLLHILMYPVP